MNGTGFVERYRVTIVLPQSKVEVMLAVLRRVTPLGDDRYDSIHWIVDGVTEGFRPLAGSQPRAGKVGELHREASVMLVVAIPRDSALLQRLLHEAVFPAHPWESPSIFIDETVQPLLPLP